MTTPVCPACTGARTRRLVAVRPLARGEEPLLIHGCADCGHRFVPTTPELQARIEGLYDEGYAGFREDPFFDAAIRREVERVVLARRPPPARILDVGCGNGEFLVAVAERGYRAEGIDVSPDAVEHCRRRGVHARAADFLTADFSDRYDVITFWDVMEHLRRPDEFLRRARSLLAPGGALLIKTPGFGALTFPLLRLYPRMDGWVLGTPAHVQLFSRSSLAALLARCGLDRLEWLPTVNLHSPPPGRTLKRRVARAVSGLVGTVARNGNLYLWAAPSENSAHPQPAASTSVANAARAEVHG